MPKSVAREHFNGRKAGHIEIWQGVSGRHLLVSWANVSCPAPWTLSPIKFALTLTLTGFLKCSTLKTEDGQAENSVSTADFFSCRTKNSPSLGRPLSCQNQLERTTNVLSSAQRLGSVFSGLESPFQYLTIVEPDPNHSPCTGMLLAFYSKGNNWPGTERRSIQQTNNWRRPKYIFIYEGY